MFLSFLAFFTTAAFAQDSSQDAWSDDIRNIFLNSCNEGRPQNISKEDMSAICSCSLKKIEAKYTPTQLQSPEAQKYSEQVGAICAVGSKGNWTNLIKDQFMGACVSKKEENVTKQQQQAICKCSLNLLEAKYDPMQLNTKEAQDFAVNAGETCAKQVFGQ